MTYHGIHVRNERADLRGNEALIVLINGICTLAKEQPSDLSMLQCMLLASSCNIGHVIIDQDPHLSYVVPYFGSACSQSEQSMSQ